MLVEATRLIRKMRGGAQAHLLECDDGHFYVVKFLNNPQHRRILINEWIASAFLNYLQISTPAAAIVNLSTAFLAGNPEIYIQLGSRHQTVEPGWHFGSRYPGDPGKVMVYDFLPDALLDKVVNAGEFLGVLAFDKWMGNADARQSIFFRARLRQWPAESAAAPRAGFVSQAPRAGFVSQMMDHGYVFDGPHWNFPDSPLQGLYFRPNVYQKVRGWDDFQPWLDRVIYFPEEVVDEAEKQIPPEWLAEDGGALQAMLEKLMSRRRRVPDLIRDSRRGRVNPFPEWK
ncbi:MAG: HipA family kinase [Bryobacteraceae bacterium]